MARKKKLNIPAGRSVTSADFEDTDDNQIEHISSDNEDNPVENEVQAVEDDCDIEEDLEPSNEECFDTVLECSEGDWVKVKFLYDKGIKTFVGKVLCTEDGNLVGTFLRQSSKCDNIFRFPDVPDECQFNKTDVLAILEPPKLQRGRYIFKVNPLK